MTLCDNGLLTYHPSLHVSGGARCTWGGLGVGARWTWSSWTLGLEGRAPELRKSCSWERGLSLGARGPHGP